ncbi:MAG: hypothetical protein R3190_14155 [Thermoanaerobaculia bacterium]|nr:hypothetical protein [Thermoanaerobaculia bacterium]
MPTSFDDDAVPTVQFDPRLEISPFLVFRRLRDGAPLALVDVRSQPEGSTLRGADRWSDAWRPPTDRQVVLFDDDGSLAVPLAERYQGEGHAHVKALFGGLQLWRFSLDPEVVGEDTFLEEV